MTTLNDLVATSHMISQNLIESGGEITPEIELILKDIDIKIPAKIDAYSHAIARLDMESAYWKSKAQDYQRIAKACERAVDTMKSNIKAAMYSLDQRSIEGNDVKFTLSATKPSLVIDESVLSDEWKMIVQESVPDKERIRQALMAGAEIKGATLVAGDALRTSHNRK